MTILRSHHLELNSQRNSDSFQVQFHIVYRPIVSYPMNYRLDRFGIAQSNTCIVHDRLWMRVKQNIRAAFSHNCFWRK